MDTTHSETQFSVEVVCSQIKIGRQAALKFAILENYAGYGKRLEADPHRPRVTKLIGQKDVWRISSYGPRHVASMSRAEQASSLLR